MDRDYHLKVPDVFREDLSRILSSVENITVNQLDDILGEVLEPLGSIILFTLREFSDDRFRKREKPDFKAIGKFKKKYGITWIKGIRLPFEKDKIVTKNMVMALREACTKSSGYKALSEDFMLLRQSKSNGLGDSPWACLLYFFDKLEEKVKKV